MNSITPHITAFFQQRLRIERSASDHTCESYAYPFKLLFEYASKALKVTPSELQLEQIDEPLVVGFLNHLQAVRGTSSVPKLFLNARGEPLTRAGFEYILNKHAHVAQAHCPSLSTKRISAHVLRNTCALTILQATKDIRKVALWLGHAHIQTTEMYTRARNVSMTLLHLAS